MTNEQATIAGKVKALINADVLDSKQVETIISNCTDALLVLLNAESVPPFLDFIIVETAVARYRKIGSEGMKSEAIETHTMSFDADVFEPYMSLINAYKSNNNQRKKVRFL